MDRRHLLRLGASSAVLVVLAGCKTANKVISDADTLAAGVQAVLPAIQAIVGVSSTTYAKVKAGIDAVTAAVHGLASATGTPALQSLGGQITAGLTAAQTALTGFQVPSWVSLALTAAEDAAPFVLAAFGVPLAPGAGSKHGRSYAENMAILRDAASRS